LAAGTKLNLEVRSQQLILSKESAWKKLRGAATAQDFMSAFAKFKEQERSLEDTRP